MTTLAKPGVCLGLGLWLLAAVVWSKGASSSSHALAQAIPVAAASTNAYWAGYVVTDRGPFTAIEASWTVPAASCAHQNLANATAFAWIGEGGYLQGLASSLIQAGTGSDCFSGVPRYHAFYEWYPGIYAADFPIELRPGDTVTVKITEAQTDFWVLTVSDDTTGERSTTSTFYRADTASADIIVERPTLCGADSCDQMPLAPFGQVTFQGIQTRTLQGDTSANVGTALPIALVNPSTARVLAVPGRTPSSSDQLAVLWRSEL